MRRIVDGVAYAATFARLWVWDRIAGPKAETEADIVRARRRERLRQAFPDTDIDGAGADPPLGARRRRSGDDFRAGHLPGG